MKTFDFYADEKHTIWTRIEFKIEAETYEQALEKIKEVEKLIDAKCEVAPEAIQILNQAAKSPVKEEKK